MAQELTSTEEIKKECLALTVDYPKFDTCLSLKKSKNKESKTECYAENHGTPDREHCMVEHITFPSTAETKAKCLDFLEQSKERRLCCHANY